MRFNIALERTNVCANNSCANVLMCLISRKMTDIKMVVRKGISGALTVHTFYLGLLAANHEIAKALVMKTPISGNISVKSKVNRHFRIVYASTAAAQEKAVQQAALVDPTADPLIQFTISDDPSFIVSKIYDANAYYEQRYPIDLSAVQHGCVMLVCEATAVGAAEAEGEILIEVTASAGGRKHVTCDEKDEKPAKRRFRE